MSEVLLLAAAYLLAAAIVLGIVLRPQTPAAPIVIHAYAPSAPVRAAPPAEPDTDLIKNSSDPMFVAFVSNFRESSINACKNSLNRFLQTANKTAADKISSICTCATERVAGTMTVGEARAASASALMGSMTENPTITALKLRFADAGKVCMAAVITR